MNRKKVLWIFSQDSGTPEMGWGDRHFYLSREFISAGFDVTIFAAAFSHKYTKNKDLRVDSPIETFEGVRYKWIRVPAYGSSTNRKRIVAWLVFACRLFFLSPKKYGRPDVIMVSSVPIFPIIPALVLSRFMRCKVVFEIRDIWPLTLVEIGRYGPNNPFILLLRLIEKIGYAKSDYITSVLDKADVHIRESIKGKFKFQWISHGINNVNPGFGKTSPVSIQVQQLAKSKFVVGYAGSMGISNATSFFIEAARKLADHPGIHFVFLGDGEAKAQHQRDAAGLPNITFFDKVQKKFVHEIISSFHVALSGSPDSKLYAFGIASLKLFDYMAAKLPILLSTSANPSIVDKANCGRTVMAESADSIVRGILELYNLDAAQRRQLGENGQVYMMRNFTYPAIGRAYLDIFHQLC